MIRIRHTGSRYRPPLNKILYTPLSLVVGFFLSLTSFQMHCLPCLHTGRDLCNRVSFSSENPIITSSNSPPEFSILIHQFFFKSKQFLTGRLVHNLANGLKSKFHNFNTVAEKLHFVADVSNFKFFCFSKIKYWQLTLVAVFFGNEQYWYSMADVRRCLNCLDQYFVN